MSLLRGKMILEMSLNKSRTEENPKKVRPASGNSACRANIPEQATVSVAATMDCVSEGVQEQVGQNVLDGFEFDSEMFDEISPVDLINGRGPSASENSACNVPEMLQVTPSVAAIIESMEEGVEEPVSPDILDGLFEFATEQHVPQPSWTTDTDMPDDSSAPVTVDQNPEVCDGPTEYETSTSTIPPTDNLPNTLTTESTVEVVNIDTHREPWQGCKPSCKRKCSEKIPDNVRTTIWHGFQKLSYNEKRQMIFQYVSRAHKGRFTAGEHGSRRDMTFQYHLKDAYGVDQQVCKTFFLLTLGFDAKNDRLITTVMKTTPTNSMAARKDMRGRHPSTRKLDRSLIKTHIDSFKPTISHYRREHAPYRKYLPSDINIQFMYSDFKEKHPNFKCGIESYRKLISEMNISFAKLGEEECEKCEAHKIHVNSDDHHAGDNGDENAVNCDICKEWEIHNRRARLSREKYQEDSGKTWPDDYVVKSGDLQKVIMLPRMPGNKTAIFTKRIVAFHETFATLGKDQKGKRKANTTSIVWHEGIAGRKAEEITSAFITALEKDRDKKHVILWLDNCSAQNKNWCLITSLVCLVNSENVDFDDITLKFFEAGHTFMAADSFHHGVEREMKNRKGGNVFDFPDFVDVVRKSNSGKVDVIVMENHNVLAYTGGQSSAKLRKSKFLLSTVSVLQVRRDSNQFFVKYQHDDNEFVAIDFLKAKFQCQIPAQLRPSVRGIPSKKKADILQKLGPLMPPSRRIFWQNLVENNTVNDEALLD